MKWKRVGDTMLESDCRVFQISRTPPPGSPTYRLWRRATNDVLLAVTAGDDEASRRAATDKCKALAEAFRV